MLIIEVLLLVYFGYVVLYTAAFSFGALFYRKQVSDRPNTPTFCILIPSYKEDAVILDTAKAAYSQNYPKELFDVVVIADSLQPSTIEKLKQIPVNVKEVVFESSTKVKALTAAVTSIEKQYDFVLILDADNIAESDFLKKIASVAALGHKAIQGQRKPKNVDTTLSLLDGISEAINNHVYRQGSTALGLSASINGSGVVFDYATFKSKITTMESIGGFDRELELLLLELGIKVHYHKDAVVLDEKVSQTKTFQNQRLRWISSQYFYLRKYFWKGCASLLKGNFTYFNSSVLRNIQLPRLINLGLLTVLTFAFYFIQDYLVYGYSVWLIMFGLLIASMMVSIPGEYYNKNLIKAILQVPVLFFRMFLLLFKLKGANKKFIHTPHGVTTDQEPKAS